MTRSTSLTDALLVVEMLLRIDELALAEEAITAIANVAPDAARLHLLRGWLALIQENRSHSTTGGERAATPNPLAAKFFRLSLGRDPLEPQAWKGLAAALAQGHAHQEAAARAARLSTSEAVVDMRRGKPYLARQQLQLLHANYHDDQEWTLWLAECLRRLGEPDAARVLVAPQLHRVPVSAPAALLAAALALDETAAYNLVAEAAAGDPAWLTARRLWAPDGPPVRLLQPPDVLLPDAVVARVVEVGERPVLQPNGDWRIAPLPPIGAPRPPARSSTSPGPTPQQPLALSAKGPGSSPERTEEPSGYTDVADVLHQVQRASQRLFGPTPAALASGEAVALIVTHRSALARRYGAAVTAEIEHRIAQLVSALGERGLRGEVLIVDEPTATGRLTGPATQDPVDVDAARVIVDRIRSVRKSFEAANQRVDAILIIGGDSVIPFHRLPNPSQDSDGPVCSDNPYGCEGGSEHVPDIVVSRLPDGGADRGELLLALLQRSIEYHEGWLVSHSTPAGLTLPFLRRFVASARVQRPVAAWGASTGSWVEPSGEIFRELGEQRPLLICPPVGPDTLGPGGMPDWATSRILFFNLHGLPGGPNWYGQSAGAVLNEPLPVAITPSEVYDLEPASICFSEACFGAEVMGRSATNSMALRFLARGVLAFVGSTATSYGSVALPLGGADILAQQVFQNLRRGQPIGRALLLARDWMARETVERQGYLDPDDAKTLLSFVLLGDPWATPYAKPATQSKLALPALEPVVALRRPMQVASVSPAAAELAQKLVAKIAPQLARAPLVALGQGRPDRIAKGQAGAIVFSASEEIPTVDGRHAQQIARITVAHGAARKVLLSR